MHCASLQAPVEELLNSDLLLCVHFADCLRLCRMQITRTMMAIISSAHILPPNVAPNIMNMSLFAWPEVGDVGSVLVGVICDMPAGLGVGEGNEGGTENEGEVEGVGEDVRSGTEDEGEPGGEPGGGAKTDQEK